MPKSFAPEFRRRVIELCRAGSSPRAVAGDLGLSEATVYRWVAQNEVDLGERPGHVGRSGVAAAVERIVGIGIEIGAL